MAKKILIVQDDADVRRDIGSRLQENQYDTAYAVDAVGAVVQARREQPDAILLELALPAGDGFVVMNRLRANTRLAGIPVIMVSKRATPVGAQRVLASGARAFVQEPLSSDDRLLRTLRDVLGEAD
jgi:CheY-like chemotaxis protein